MTSTSEERGAKSPNGSERGTATILPLVPREPREPPPPMAKPLAAEDELPATDDDDPGPTAA